MARKDIGYKRVGYSLLKISTKKEEAWNYILPWKFKFPGGVVNFDKVDLVVPDSKHPTHRVVERWAVKMHKQPKGTKFGGYENPKWNARKKRVEVTPIWIEVDNTRVEEVARKDEIATACHDFRVLVRNGNADDIKKWVGEQEDIQKALTDIILYLAK